MSPLSLSNDRVNSVSAVDHSLSEQALLQALCGVAMSEDLKQEQTGQLVH
jgi:hypothetical protein